MLRKYIMFLLFALLLLASSSAFAQGPPCPACPEPDTPIDGGLGVLLAIGVGYAVSKLRSED